MATEKASMRPSYHTRRKLRLVNINKGNSKSIATSFRYSQIRVPKLHLWLYLTLFLSNQPFYTMWMGQILHYVIINDVITSKRVLDNPSIRIKEVQICEDLLYVMLHSLIFSLALGYY